MGRRVNEATITTKASRERLPTSKTVRWRAIDRGAHLGYRKGADGGTWVARFRRDDGVYRTEALGKADDSLEANGADVLDYYQAQAASRAWCEEQAAVQAGVDTEAPYTVADAIADYLDWYKLNRRAYQNTKTAADAHIVPALGEKLGRDLTSREIRRWHAALATSPARLRRSRHGPMKTREKPATSEAQRKRKSTANRVLTIFKAAMSHAVREGHVSSDAPWKNVAPFKNVDAATIRYLSEAECLRVVNACEGKFRDLVRGALLTGCRYGELTEVLCADFNPDSGTVQVRQTKAGNPRHVFLSDEGRRFFVRITAGREGDKRIFLRDDDGSWGKSHQRRRLEAACERAKISPPVSFHIFRHTHASHLAMSGVPMPVIAAQLGHADTRVSEKHYAHLAPSYVANTIRAGMPVFGIDEADNVVPLSGKRAETSIAG